jgi:hypothetical protein
MYGKERVALFCSTMEIQKEKQKAGLPRLGIQISPVIKGKTVFVVEQRSGILKDYF